MQILFQNQDIIVVEKPHGWLTTPSRLGKEDLRPCLGTTLQQELQRQVWPVHRLDEPVSGIVLFALNAETHRQFCKLFEQRRVKKTYTALTLTPPAKIPIGAAYTWKTKILRGKKRAYEHVRGALAITNAEVLSSLSKNNLSCLQWRLTPETGRPHQLRFHLAQFGTPILGDSLYGSSIEFLPGTHAIALHATQLEFQEGELPAGCPSIFKITDDSTQEICTT